MGFDQSFGIRLRKTALATGFAVGMGLPTEASFDGLEKTEVLPEQERIAIIAQSLGAGFEEAFGKKWDIDVPVTAKNGGGYVVHIGQIHAVKNGFEGVRTRSEAVVSQRGIADIIQYEAQSKGVRFVFSEGYPREGYAKDLLKYVRSLESDLEAIDSENPSLQDVQKMVKVIREYTNGKGSYRVTSYQLPGYQEIWICPLKIILR